MTSEMNRTVVESRPSYWRSLRELVPEDVLITDPVELIPYELDGSLGVGHPAAVVLPRTQEQVRTMVRWASEHDVPIVPRGAGTGLSGGAVATQGGMVLSFARMKRVVEMDDVGRSVVIEPGIVHLDLDEFVKTRGLYYPPDPASGRSATLGGNLGENAGGPHCFKYGVTTNYVIGLDVILADGRVIRTGGRAYDYPEYDLTGLIVGSEGTLGVVTQAYLRLMRNVPGVKTLMVVFDSVEQAGEAVSSVIARGLVPGTLEMMDRNMIGIVEAFAHAGLPTDAEALLIIEADGYPASLEPQMAQIVKVMEALNAREWRLAKTAAERDQIWFARKSAFGAIAQISPSYYIVDGTVPRSALAEALRQINQVCARHDLRVGYVFHAGDGNLHPLVLFDPAVPEMVERVLEAGHEIMQLCVDLGGTITGEHGVGSEKRKYMPLMFTPDELRAMSEVKEVFDPRHLLNPGKILPDSEPSSKPRAKATAPPGSRAEPASLQELAEAIAGWNALGTPVTVRGGGTKSSLSSSRNGDGAAEEAMLSTGLLRGIRTLSADDLFVTVGAGTTLSELQAELYRHRVWVPLRSPWAKSTVGGIVSTNFNAPLRMRYGGIRDLVLAASVVLPDGRVFRGGRAVVKNVAGYDLLKLFIGAYGTLGVIADVTFKLAPVPRMRKTLLVPIDDLSHGITLGGHLLRVCLVASSLLLCRARDLPAMAGLAPSTFTLVYTAEGLEEDVEAEMVEVHSVLEAEGVSGAVQARDDDLPPDASDSGKAQVSGSMLWAQWLSERGRVVRVGVPPRDVARLMVDLGPVAGEMPFIADFASGLVYLGEVADLTVVRRLALDLGGYAIILPPADGRTPGLESVDDPWGYSPDGLDLMRALKARWDPRSLLNPGAFVT
jgi:D-lactate dehydrogenase (cytochrome)